MKILFLSDNFPPEGNAPATRLWEHATRWVAAGHEVTVITCAPNFPEGKGYPGYRNAWRSVEMMGSIRVVRVKTYITSNEGFVKRSLDYVSFMVAAVAAGLGPIRTAARCFDCDLTPVLLRMRGVDFVGASATTVCF